MLLVLLAHGVTALLAPLVALHVGRWVFPLTAVAPLVALGYGAAHAGEVLSGGAVSEQTQWVPGLDLSIDLRLDAMGLLMLLLVSGIGVLVFVYAGFYFQEGNPRCGRTASTLTAFSGAMLGLILSDQLFTLFLFWELTTITSYLLVGFKDEDPAARAAALQAVLVTALGALCMLAGFAIVTTAAGTASISEIVESPPQGMAVSVALLLILLGALTKSAQVPFHFWLPGAMAAPTPVSAYLHSATMVKAGVYLVARLAPAFAVQGAWRPVVFAAGLVSMWIGGWRALRQHDGKLLLAFGTVSQLGFMLVLLGAGVPGLTYAGVLVLFAHALFKAPLFLAVGIVDHQAGTRDFRKLPNLWRAMPLTIGVAGIAAASMAAVPPCLGFIAKEEAFIELFDSGLTWGLVVLIGVAAASVLTVAYSARLTAGLLGRGASAKSVTQPPRPTLAFQAPGAVLAAVSLLFGLAPFLLDPLVNAAAAALDPRVEPVRLALWQGLKPALFLSLAVLLAGVALVALGQRWDTLQGRLAVPFSASTVYRTLLRTLPRVANRTTTVMQSGSLPVYLMVILGVTTILPGAWLVTSRALPESRRLFETPAQAFVGLMTVAAAFAVIRSRRRFPAVLMMGAVGYSVAGLFLLQGAPDLAVTQLLVETLTVVMFVLGLRRLPDRFGFTPSRSRRAIQILVATLAAGFVFTFALLAGSHETNRVSDFHIEEGLPSAGGRNVVNVILVDFRGIDTLGEITVLATAGLGLVSLVAPVLRRKDAR